MSKIKLSIKEEKFCKLIASGTRWGWAVVDSGIYDNNKEYALLIKHRKQCEKRIIELKKIIERRDGKLEPYQSKPGYDHIHCLRKPGAY